MSKVVSISTYMITAGFIEDICISDIRQSRNIRRQTPAIEELSASIGQKGLLQPIMVRTMDPYFEIVTGNRSLLVKNWDGGKLRVIS